jgi:hypothetical protein
VKARDWAAIPLNLPVSAGDEMEKETSGSSAMFSKSNFKKIGV